MITGNDPVGSGTNEAHLIKLQAQYSCTPNFRFSCYPNPAINPFKVINPAINSRIEQTCCDTRIGIKGLLRRKFALITTGTCKTQIVRIVSTIRVNMIDCHGLPGQTIAGLTVLAATLRTSIHKSSDRLPGEISQEDSYPAVLRDTPVASKSRLLLTYAPSGVQSARHTRLAD